MTNVWIIYQIYVVCTLYCICELIFDGNKRIPKIMNDPLNLFNPDISKLCSSQIVGCK